MGPTRKSRSLNRRYTHEDSPSKDEDSTKRSSGRKRKLSDMLGPRWTAEELSRFYGAYRKYNKDWRKIASSVRNRSPEMMEALYTMNKAYLSLPHGTASSDGLIAMMTDHYCNLAGSDSDLESNDGTGSSRKTKKQVTVPDYGFLPFLKKKRSGGGRPCPVGKRTPRFPVSFPSEKFIAESNVSPRRPGLKLKVNANDDEVAQEIAIALAEASHKGSSSKVSRTPSTIAECVMSSPFRYAQSKHSLAETTSNQNAALDEEELEGSTEADTGELSRYKPSLMEPRSPGTVKEKTKKLKGKKYEIGNNTEHLLDDIKEECSGTEEGQRFGAMTSNFHVEVADTKISNSSAHSQRKKSKKILYERDDAPAFDALQTLADLSLLMPMGDEDDSRLHFKDGGDDPVDELMATESLPINQKREKRQYSGVRMKGHKPLSSSKVAPSKTSKPGKASVTSSVPEEDQDLQPSITKTPKRKQKMQVSKIPKTEARPDLHLSRSPRVEDGDPGKKLMIRSKKSSQSGSPHSVRNSGNSCSADIQKEASEPTQAAQVPVVNQVHLPTKVRSRRKMDLKKPQKLFDNISNYQSDLSIASVHGKALKPKENMSICLSNPRLRRWCIYEWFYSAIDYPWFAKREFVEYLYHVGLGHVPRLTRVEWGVIRSSLGKPRRFSEQFLKEEKEKLNQYRYSVRKHYTELREGVREGLPTDLARPLSVGQRVTAIHPKTREVHDGSVLTVDHSRCRVQFDQHELGVEFVLDIDCMPLNPLENLPTALVGKQPISVDKFFGNFNELKMYGRIQEYMKLCPGDKVVAAGDMSHLSLSADPASLLNQTKVSSANTNLQMRIGSAETPNYQQTAYSQIQAKEADVQALADLTRALEKKEAVVLELRRMNDDVARHQIDGDSSLKDSEPFKKQYAAVLVQLNETNDQVSSALYSLRQRNTYQGSMPLLWSRPCTNSADPGGEFSVDHSACQSGPHVNDIINSSRTKARAMVDAAMQAVSSLKCREGTIEKIEEAIDYVNDRLPSDDSSIPMAPNPKSTSVSDTESQIPFELISKCVATLLMIQKCTQRQFPPSDVAQILDSAVTSLQPRSTQNLPVYSEIQKCMGIIRNQIMALIPT
ncbi:protein ALWAYS EARLY 3-like [Salvia divinorum]|uniref:Protein ALWAYS EARLY 3-like n=1 Tax=Salvia divinorum TaxID=28513 RepID=A0ABD1G4Q4_SALDI